MGDDVLIVANLSRFAQFVELDLSRFKGSEPVELFGQTGEPHHVGKQHSHGSTLRLGGRLG